MAIVLWLAFGLFVLSAIGHGIWLAVAAVLRALFGQGGPTRLTPRDLAAVAKYYRALLAEGVIEAREYTRLHNLLDIEYRRRQMLPPARAITAPVPKVPSETQVPKTAGVTLAESAGRAAVTADMPPILATMADAPPAPAAFPPGVSPTPSPAPAAPRRAKIPAHRKPPVPSPFDFEETPSRPPRRPWSEVLQAFMQEKNIRWGELISGILIVGSAVGLVVSLRQELQRTIPYFPALLFMAITGAIHGAGLYSLKKWKLETTSRGMLTIGLLLVPLNLFAACLLSRGGGRSVTDPTFLGALVVGLVGFGAMTLYGARPLFSRANAWLVAVAVLGSAFWQIVLHRGLDETSGFLAANLLLAPVVLGFVAANGLFAHRQPLEPVLPDKPGTRAEQQLLAVGLTLFALVCAFAMAVLAVGEVGRALDLLAPVLIPLAALGFLLPGSRLMRMTTTNWSSVAGLALILLGVFQGALALVWAWPAPAAMASAAALSALVASGAAYVTRSAWFTGAAAVGLSIATVLGLHLLVGTYEGGPALWPAQHGRALISMTTSVGLAGLGIAFIGLAAGLPRAGWRLPAEHLRTLAGVGAAVSSASVVVALVASALTATGASLTTASAVLLWHALAALLAGSLLGHRSLLRAGHALLLITLLHVSYYHAHEWSWLYADDSKLSVVLLACAGHVALASVVALGARVGGATGTATEGSPPRGRVAVVGCEFAGAALLVAGPLVVLALALDLWHPGRLAVEYGLVTLAMAAGLGLLALPVLFSLFQAALYVTALAAASAVALEWGYRWHWTEPAFLAFQLTIVATVGAVWNAWDLLRGRGRAALAVAPQYRVDIAISGLATVCLFLLALTSCIPGIVQEFGWRVVDPQAAASTAWLTRWQESQVLWVPWVAIVACLVAGQFGRARPLFREGLVISLFGMVLTWASRFAPQLATASAVRWLLSSSLLGMGLGSIAMWHLLSRFRRTADASAAEVLVTGSRTGRHTYVWSSIVCSLTPLVVLMIVAMVRGVSGGAFAGPSPAIWMGAIGAEANYGLPLLLALGALQTIGWDRRDVVFARAGASVLVLLVITWVIAALNAPPVFDRALFMTRYCHLSALVLALYGSAWLLLEHRTKSGATSAATLLQGTYVGIALATAAVPSLAALGYLLAGVRAPASMLRVLGGPLPWFAAAAAFAMAGVWLRPAARWLQSVLGTSVLVVLTGLVAAHLQNAWPQEWPALRAALVGLLGVAAVVALAPFGRWRFTAPIAESEAIALRAARSMMAAAALLLVGVALVRVAYADPQPVRWFLAGIATAIALTWLAQWSLAGWFSYMGIAAVVLGAVIVGDLAPPPLEWGRHATIFHAMIVLCCGYGVVCSLVQFAARRYPLRPAAANRFSAGHLVMARGLAWGGAFLVAGAALVRWSIGREIPWSEAVLVHPFGIASLLAMGTLLMVTLGESSYRQRLILVYVWGFTSTMFGVALVTHGAALHAFMGLALSGYAAATAYLWRHQMFLWKIARRWGMVAAGEVIEPTERWFLGSQFALVTLTTMLQLPIVLNDALRTHRMAGALTPLCGALAVAALSSVARSTQRQGQLALATLVLFSLFCVYGSWADLAPLALTQNWLPRLLRLAVVGALLTFVFGTLVPRLVAGGDVWGPALRRMTAAAGSVATASLLWLLAAEVAQFVRLGVVRLSLVETTMTAVMFLVMAIGLVATALRPEGAEAGLTLRRRQACIYAAELIGALLAVHIGVAMPWLLRPEWRPYWPYGVMLLAFAGAGAAEVCRRRKIEVLAEPVMRTALLLPVAPFVLMWFLSTQADFALVLFLGGLLYLAMGITRASPWYMLAAAACGNVALWNLIGRSDALDFTRHPQLWLIPPALSALAATYGYGNRLTAAQRSMSSYACALVIYVSSTAEVFLQGIGTQLWPPMVLIALAVAGVLLGILLQVRAFLILGTSFVFVSMFSMVMHAQRVLHHVWPWWAFGIGLGIAILAFFAVFEKKRAEMLDLVQRVRQWQ